MATSGSVDFSVSRTNIIESALRKCGVLDSESGSATSTQLTNGAEGLNVVCKAFMADGMPLWAIKKANFSLTASTNSYAISSMTGVTLPEKIVQAFRRDSSVTPNTDMPMTIISRDEYWRLSAKASTGSPVQFYYDRQLTTALATVYVFPTPNATSVTNHVIHFFYQRPFEDFDAAADTPDFPQYWYSAVIWELASVLGFEYGVPDRKLTMITQKALFEKQKALDFGMEEGSVYLTPDYITLR